MIIRLVENCPWGKTFLTTLCSYKSPKAECSNPNCWILGQKAVNTKMFAEEKKFYCKLGKLHNGNCEGEGGWCSGLNCPAFSEQPTE